MRTKFNSLLYKTNRFHVAVHLSSNRSQRTSKCGKNISDTLGYRLVCHSFCSYHILTSSVIYYWTDARQHGIYLLSGSADVKKRIFTITAEILARSLVNFYRQYADRHMNLKFVRQVSERAIPRPIVIVKNKLMSVFNESVLLLTTNFVITLSK